MRTYNNDKPIGAWRRLTLLSACLLLVLTVACKNDKSMLQEDRSDSASQEVLDARIHRTENGKLQLELNAPIIQKYEKPVAKTIYRSRGDRRVSMTLYENGASVKTYIEAGNAISYDDRDIMEAHDSVVVIDYTSGDTIYLYDLIWNSAEDNIYSEHPVRAKNGNRITLGDGFVSDQRLENMQIIRQRGIIEFED